MFKMSWVILTVLLAGYFAAEFIGVPVSFVAGIVALIFYLMGWNSEAVNTRKVVRNAPWSIVVFSIGMYVVVFGLQNAGLTDLLATVIQYGADRGRFAGTMLMGYLAALLSAVMTNKTTIQNDALSIPRTCT